MTPMQNWHYVKITFCAKVMLCKSDVWSWLGRNWFGLELIHVEFDWVGIVQVGFDWVGIVLGFELSGSQDLCIENINLII